MGPPRRTRRRYASAAGRSVWRTPRFRLRSIRWFRRRVSRRRQDLRDIEGSWVGFLGNDGRADQLVEFGKFAVEIRVAFGENFFLLVIFQVGAHSTAGVFAVAGIKFLNDVHPFD